MIRSGRASLPGTNHPDNRGSGNDGRCLIWIKPAVKIYRKKRQLNSLFTIRPLTAAFIERDKFFKSFVPQYTRCFQLMSWYHLECKPRMILLIQVHQNCSLGGNVLYCRIGI